MSSGCAVAFRLKALILESDGQSEFLGSRAVSTLFPVLSTVPEIERLRVSDGTSRAFHMGGL
ncbi:hypothetical protein SBA2_410039 [Acidobacteriia bacterium SbA2]|nr:hypothetical protein SBA2_410039 [Acidobacteriia bacterium SbA2]